MVIRRWLSLRLHIIAWWLDRRASDLYDIDPITLRLMEDDRR